MLTTTAPIVDSCSVCLVMAGLARSIIGNWERAYSLFFMTVFFFFFLTGRQARRSIYLSHIEVMAGLLLPLEGRQAEFPALPLPTFKRFRQWVPSADPRRVAPREHRRRLPDQCLDQATVIGFRSIIDELNGKSVEWRQLMLFRHRYLHISKDLYRCIDD